MEGNCFTEVLGKTPKRAVVLVSVLFSECSLFRFVGVFVWSVDLHLGVPYSF